MMLRTLVLVAAAIGFTFALVGAVIDPGVWPSAVLFAVLLVGIVFERRRYGAAQARPAAGEGEWRETSERFIDDTTGREVTVWFDPRSGARRYVDTRDTDLNDIANKSQR